MKLIAITAGLLVSCVAAACDGDASPRLEGTTVRDTRSAGRIVICKYAERGVRYEIVSDTGSCAATLDDGSGADSHRLATLERSAAK